MSHPKIIEDDAPRHLELYSTSSKPACLVNEVRGPFSGTSLPYKLPCTADEHRSCQIVPHLSTWNEFLFQVRMEIRVVIGAWRQLSVLSFDCPELPNDGNAHLHQIAMLLHWLLRTHHCVKSFCASPSRFKTYQWLFRDALLKSSSIEILKLDFTRFDVCKNVCNIVAAAHCVKELELHSDGLSTAGVVSALSTVLKITNTLVILKISHVIMTRPDADEFFRSLAENKTLRELSVNESAFSEASVASRTLFANLLEREDTTRALAISKGSEVWYRYTFMPTALPMRWILKSLLANRTVTSLNLAYVVIDGESARLLRALFKQSKILRKFCFASSTMDLRFQTRLTFDCWIETLAENDSLQELTLPFGI
ncbi:hypothetical protein MRX96_021232 [Rhipicephalus microplus]